MKKFNFCSTYFKIILALDEEKSLNGYMKKAGILPTFLFSILGERKFDEKEKKTMHQLIKVNFFQIKIIITIIF